MASGIHDGHRKRLREKYKNGKEIFNEHELLELLLGYAIARKDTNELAHKLIKEFGSLSKILSMPVEVLSQVDGVGETTATLLSLVGYVSTVRKKEKALQKMDSISAVKKIAIDLFKDLTKEVLYIFYVDANKNVISYSFLCDECNSSVAVDFDKIAKDIIAYKPKSVVIMHNHFSKYPLPSENDDKATANVYTFLNFHKVALLDHIIVSGNEIYSYFYDGRLESIKKRINEKFN